MPEVFSGRTVDAEAPFLSASFWKEGVSVRGVITKIFETEMLKDGIAKKSKCYTLDLNPTQTPELMALLKLAGGVCTGSVDVEGEEQERVSVGNMAGLQMALTVMKRERDGKLGTLSPQLKDVLEITCAGVKPATKEGYSDRVNFDVKITRP